MEDIGRSLFEYIGGVPLINSNFQWRKLLSLVAHKRKEIKTFPNLTLAEYINPALGEQIYKGFSGSEIPSYKTIDLSKSELNSISRALSQVIQNKPDWEPIFGIPIRYFKLCDNRVSSTCSLIPQTIFWGKHAFDNNEILIESLIHEFSHVWLDFLIEVYDLQKKDAHEKFVLPSGQSSKTVRGVLLAAHFSSSLLEYYKATPNHNDSFTNNRITYLLDYLESTLKISRACDEKTALGSIIEEELTGYINEYQKELSI